MRLHPSTCYPQFPSTTSTQNRLLSRISPLKRYQTSSICFIGCNPITYSTISCLLSQKCLIHSIKLFDIHGIKQAKLQIFDLQVVAILNKLDVKIQYSHSYYETKNSTLVIINVQHNRLANESIMKWTQINAYLIETVVLEICKYSPNCSLLIVTQPNELMTYFAWKVSGFSSDRVIGVGAAVETAHLYQILSQSLLMTGKMNGVLYIGDNRHLNECGNILSDDVNINGIIYNDLKKNVVPSLNKKIKTKATVQDGIRSAKFVSENEMAVKRKRIDRQTPSTRPRRLVKSIFRANENTMNEEEKDNREKKDRQNYLKNNEKKSDLSLLFEKDNNIYLNTRRQPSVIDDISLREAKSVKYFNTKENKNQTSSLTSLLLSNDLTNIVKKIYRYKTHSNWTQSFIIAKLCRAILEGKQFQSNLAVNIYSLYSQNQNENIFLNYPVTIAYTIENMIPLYSGIKTINDKLLRQYKKLQMSIELKSMENINRDQPKVQLVYALSKERPTMIINNSQKSHQKILESTQTPNITQQQIDEKEDEYAD
ncbi:unnamed protein product [Didymodactylos carnosus]|uniref:Lactate/malate dehydrogenase N-terminal domain-containing protein n=1 Tax=Didymodactylos carnosus TaxID=1234261 RepID=A0A8S2DEU0_9BILA|nr:unnamed protein product [Didymodactylos carnosus]CAF3717708.1 unnamed protein product [Didymodactylos carnosus]